MCSSPATAKADSELTEAEIMAFRQRRLARFKVPKRGWFAENIPRNPDGKTWKRWQREAYSDRVGDRPSS